MSYQVTVYEVMIASPGDVAEERNIVREVIHEWNDINASTKHVVLLPVGWETHSSPEIGARAQEIVNKQVLQRCDILVGVFWTKIGTATGTYASGTVEEIERHVESGKLAMLYFSQRPAIPDSIDQNQYQELSLFKAACKKRALYSEFSGPNTFKDMFAKHLSLKMNETRFLQPTVNSTKKEEAIEKWLSPEATVLLSRTARSSGIFLYLQTMGSSSIEAGDWSVELTDSRTEATWRAAIDELVGQRLAIRSQGNRGGFRLTKSGYDLADTLPK